MTELEQVTLDTIGGGVIPELFEREFAVLMKNVDDPSTDPKAVRKLTIEIFIQPHESREMAAVAIKCNSKLASVKPSSVAVHLVRKDGFLIAVANNPRQLDAFKDASLREVKTNA